MAEENQNAFDNVDIGMFNEASEFIMGRQEQEINPEEFEKTEVTGKEEKTPLEKTEEELAAEKAALEEEKIKSPSSQENKDSSRLTPYFKLLVEEGVFDENDEKDWDGTTSGILDLRHKKQQAQWEQYKSETLDPRTKWLQDNIEEGVALEDLLKVDKEAVALNQITDEALEENLDLQKTVAAEYYRKTSRFSPERIEKQIKMLEDSGELKEESKAFSNELRDINKLEEQQLVEKARQDKLNAAKAQKEALDTFRATLNKTEEIIPGMKVNSLMRDKIYNTLTTTTSVDEQGNPLNKITEARLKDPMNFEIKLAYIYELTNGFTDYSALGTAGKKRAFSEFEKAASNLDRKPSSTHTETPQNDGEFLNELEKMYKQGSFR